MDHIAWELARRAPGGGAGEGARFRIVEQFGSDRYAVDVTDRVEKLDDRDPPGAARRRGAILQLEHTWSAGSDGAHYVSVLDIGARAALWRPVNHC